MAITITFNFIMSVLKFLDQSFMNDQDMTIYYLPPFLDSQCAETHRCQ